MCGVGGAHTCYHSQGRINSYLTGGVQIFLGGGVHWCVTKEAARVPIF